MGYDLSRWAKPVFNFDTVKEFSDAPLNTDGVYRVKMIDGNYLDMMITNTHLLSRSLDTIGVCMTGAVFPRGGKSAPFFSGLSILKDKNCLVISISDPSLALSKKLTLGWYLGYLGNTIVPDLIAEVLDALAVRLRAKIVLYGGSGGGFASILISSLMTEKVGVLVWNPQTSISQYNYGAVKQYVEEAFNIDIGDDLTEKELFQRIARLGVRHCLRNIDFNNNIQILYLQNSSDEHTYRHMLPFLQDRVTSIDGNSIYSNHDRSIVACVGDWGIGHAVPPKSVIIAALDTIIGDEELLRFIKEASREINVIDHDKLNGAFLGSLSSRDCAAFFSETDNFVRVGISDRAPINGAGVTYRMNFSHDNAARILVRFDLVFSYYNPKYSGRIKYAIRCGGKELIADSSAWMGREAVLVAIPSGGEKCIEVCVSSFRNCENWNWGEVTALQVENVTVKSTLMVVDDVKISSTHPFLVAD